MIGAGERKLHYAENHLSWCAENNNFGYHAAAPCGAYGAATTQNAALVTCGSCRKAPILADPVRGLRNSIVSDFSRALYLADRDLNWDDREKVALLFDAKLREYEAAIRVASCPE